MRTEKQTAFMAFSYPVPRPLRYGAPAEPSVLSGYFISFWSHTMLYIVINNARHTKDTKYRTHPDFPSAFAEAKRLSRKQPNDIFVVNEVRPLGRVIGGKDFPIVF
jgi:hypothetical protein